MEWEEEEEREEGRERLKKGPWTAGEDAILIAYVEKHGDGNWNAVQRNSGLARCGKSCRLRWANHLRPNLKKGSFTLEEENTIIDLHRKLGNKWARMANHLPGRTDNEIKNYWNTRTKRRIRAGLPLYSPPHQQNKEQVPSLSPSFSFPPYQNPSIRRPRTDHLLNLPSATMAAFLQYPTSLSPSSPSNYYRRLLPLSLSPSSSPSNSPQTTLTPSLSPASFLNNHYQPCLRHSLSSVSSPGSYGQTLAPRFLSPSNNYHPTSPNKYHETLLIPLSLSPSSSPNNHLHQTLLPHILSPISSPCSYHQTYISESSSLSNYNQTLLPPSLSLSSSPPSKYNQTFLPCCLYPSSSSPNNYHQTILPHSLSPSSSSPNNHHETPLSYSLSPSSTQSPSPLPLAEGEEVDRLACAVMDNPPSLISNYYGHPDENNTIITRLRDQSMTSMHNNPFPIYGTTSATTPSTTVSEYLSSCCPNLLMDELLLQQCQSAAVPSKSKQTDLQNHPLQHSNPLPTTKQFLFQPQAHEEDHLLPYYSVDSDWSLANILLSIPPTITTNTTPLPAAATMSSAIATSMKLHSHSQELLQQVSATSQEPTSNILQRWLDEATAGGSSELDHLLSRPPIQIRPTEQR